jgi:hypothetical protein
MQMGFDDAGMARDVEHVPPRRRVQRRGATAGFISAIFQAFGNRLSIMRSFRMQ